MMRHYEESVSISARPEDIFVYADNHDKLSSHMNKSTGMMGGGKMITEYDDGRGQRVGSHIRMTGKAFGIPLALDEAITEHNPPHHKAWETVGDINLIVIDHYKMGFDVTPEESGRSTLRVYIDYDLPKSAKTKMLGALLSGPYAKWCVRQMITDVKEHFESEKADI